MDRFEAMESFVAVADHGGFSAAARALRISPPGVTRAIAWLEAHLGARLFHRSTRSVILTEDGTLFLDKARAVLRDLADAERSLVGAHGVPQGLLYLTAPVVFGRLHVLPVVTRLLALHSDLRIEMMLVDRNVRIIEEGIDVAVRIGPLGDSALKALRIGTVRQMIVASPSYLAEHPAPTTPADLKTHRLIGSTGPRASGEWRFGANRAHAVPISPRLTVNTIEAAIAAAEAGVGIANLLSYQVEEAIRAGRLVELAFADQPPALPIHLMFDASRSTLPSVRAFVDAMRKSLTASNPARAPRPAAALA